MGAVPFGLVMFLGIPHWYWFCLLIAVGANQLASYTTQLSIMAMSSVSDFALSVRRMNLAVLPYYTAVLYGLIVFGVTWYAWPVIDWFRRGKPPGPSDLVQRRAISVPFAIAAAGFSAWAMGPIFFPLITVGLFGRWSVELMSQQVLAPVVNGFLASIASFLLMEQICRVGLIPHVFPSGGLAGVGGALRLGVRGRLFLFLGAVAFVPLFTMLGLIRAAASRLEAGMSAEALLASLTDVSQYTFFIFVTLGVVLTIILARSLTRPLELAADAMQKVQQGDLGVQVAVGSSDEIGRLEEGVNDMVVALRDRERILATFGRVVEPAVRDQLLSGRYEHGGEQRRATILFCDLRGFTALSEDQPPDFVVSMLNEFFTTTTSWVRDCGGFVDKFIGDALLVVFGLFDEDPGRADASVSAVSEPGVEARAAAAAVRCATGMRERLADLNRRRAEVGGAPLAVSIAIHSGEVVAGAIGSSDRHEYTVIGDTVNVTARLERLSKERSGAVVVSDATLALAHAAGVEIPDGEADSVFLRGRKEPVAVRVLA